MLKIGYMTLTPETSGSPMPGPSVYKMAPDTEGCVAGLGRSVVPSQIV